MLLLGYYIIMKSLTQYINESMSNVLLWIDDIRNPMDPIWQKWIKRNFGTDKFNVTWLKSYDEVVDFVNKFGVPDNVSFDHDLGDIHNPKGEKTGYDCVKFIVDYCMDNDRDFPNYRIQSDNGPGRENMDKYIKNFKKHCR